MALNPKQEAFCREFAIDRNATQAALRAGYSKQTAYAQGCRLLKNAEVQQCIDELTRAQVKRQQVSADRIVQELERLALVDPGHLVDKRGRTLPLHEIPEDVRRAISSITYDKFGQPQYRLCSKEKTLELLGRYRRLFADVEVDVGAGSGKVSITINGVRKGDE